MLTKGNYYPGQEANEEVLLFLRRHIWGFVWPLGILISFMVVGWIAILISFGITLVTGNLLFGLFPPWSILLALSVYAYIILVVSLTAWMSWYLDITIVTRTHLVDINQKGFVNRQISEQSLLRVQDVSAKAVGFLQTWFRYGTVYVETAGESPNFTMPNIPRPNVVANTILKLHDELVAKGGYEGMIAEGVGDLGYELPRHKVAEPKNTSSLKDREKEMLKEAYQNEEKIKDHTSVEPNESNKEETKSIPEQKDKIMEGYERVEMSEGEEVLPPQEETSEKVSFDSTIQEENFDNSNPVDKEGEDTSEGNLEEGKSVKF